MKKNPPKIDGQLSVVNCQLSIVNCSPKGFSLIELVFAMAFLTLIIMGVVNLQSSNLSMISSQNNQIQANFLANQGISVVRALGYEKLDEINGILTFCRTTLSKTPNDYILDPCQAGETVVPEIVPPEELFERYIEIEKAGLNNAFKVTVIVEWEDSAGSHHRKDENGDLMNAHAEAKTIVFQ